MCVDNLTPTELKALADARLTDAKALFIDDRSN
jgi:hypothetical protein